MGINHLRNFATVIELLLLLSNRVAGTLYRMPYFHGSALKFRCSFAKLAPLEVYRILRITSRKLDTCRLHIVAL